MIAIDLSTLNPSNAAAALAQMTMSEVSQAWQAMLDIMNTLPESNPRRPEARHTLEDYVIPVYQAWQGMDVVASRAADYAVNPNFGGSAPLTPDILAIVQHILTAKAITAQVQQQAAVQRTPLPVTMPTNAQTLTQTAVSNAVAAQTTANAAAAAVQNVDAGSPQLAQLQQQLDTSSAIADQAVSHVQEVVSTGGLASNKTVLIGLGLLGLMLILKR